jgi:hypothetical protein
VLPATVNDDALVVINRTGKVSVTGVPINNSNPGRLFTDLNPVSLIVLWLQLMELNPKLILLEQSVFEFT